MTTHTMLTAEAATAAEKRYEAAQRNALRFRWCALFVFFVTYLATLPSIPPLLASFLPADDTSGTSFVAQIIAYMAHALLLVGVFLAVVGHGNDAAAAQNEHVEYLTDDELEEFFDKSDALEARDWIEAGLAAGCVPRKRDLLELRRVRALCPPHPSTIYRDAVHEAYTRSRDRKASPPSWPKRDA